jgi:hypothetical protein
VQLLRYFHFFIFIYVEVIGQVFFEKEIISAPEWREGGREGWNGGN